MDKRKTVVVCGLTLIALVMASSVQGKEFEKAPTLQTVVVTGTRTEQLAEHIPANISVITVTDIERSNAKNVVDLLQSQEGIVVRDLLGNGKTAQVDMRGFGESGPYNTLVLVDGRRINAIDLSGVDWNQIPLEQIERIEIVRGNGSVLYGDNAAGGVINIITKIPSRKFYFDGGVTAGSYGKNKEQISVSGGSDNLLLSLSAGHNFTEGYRDNGEFRSKDLAGKVIFDPLDRLSITLSGSSHADDYGLPGPLTRAEVDADREATNRPYDEGESKDRYLRLGFDVDMGRRGNLVADFSYRDRLNDADFVVYSSAIESDSETWAVTPRYVWDGRIGEFADRLVAGVDFYWSEQNGESFFGAPLSLAGLSATERDSHGFYLRNELHPLESLILSLGVRREKVVYDLRQEDLASGLAPLDESLAESETAYSAGLTFTYSGRSSVFARFNRSFRVPLVDEMAIFDYSLGAIKLNAELQPQIGNHYEVGVRHYFTPQIQGRVTFFRAEIDDEIFFNPSTFNNENHPQTLHQGFEIGARADLCEKVTLRGNYTYTKATFEKDPFEGNAIPAVPRHRANLGIQIYNLFPGLRFSADYEYAGNSFAISDQANTFDKLDDYYTVNARISYKWKRCEAFFGVNNITNQEYSQYAVIGGFPSTLHLYPAPTTTWLAGLRISF